MLECSTGKYAHQQAQKITDLGIKPVVTNTIMETLEDKVRLANEVSNLLENWYGD